MGKNAAKEQHTTQHTLTSSKDINERLGSRNSTTHMAVLASSTRPCITSAHIQCKPIPLRIFASALPRRGYSSGPVHDHDRQNPIPGDTTSHPSSSTSPQSSSSSSSSSPLRSHFAPHIQRLQSTLASHRSHYTPKIRSELSRLSEKWNTYSGYDAIETAKRRVIEAEAHLASLRKLQSEARQRYLGTVDQRSVSQKTLNDLLQRKASWSDDDLVKYTSLLRSEHSEAREEEAAREEFDAAERQVATAWDQVVKTTLERYHDEQVWSDRVRNVSSYTQLAAVALNLVIFMLAIFLVEPYKRRKLAQTFEERLLKGEEQGRVALEQVINTFETTVKTLQQDLTQVKQGQEALLTKAGFDREHVVAVVDAEEQQQQLDAVDDPSQPLVQRIKKQTRFLTHPVSQHDKDRRRDVAAATGLGIITTLLVGTLIRLVAGS